MSVHIEGGGGGVNVAITHDVLDLTTPGPSDPGPLPFTRLGGCLLKHIQYGRHASYWNTFLSVHLKALGLKWNQNNSLNVWKAVFAGALHFTPSAKLQEKCFVS